MFRKILIANRGEIAVRVIRRRDGSASPRSPSITTPTAMPLHVAGRRGGAYRAAAGLGLLSGHRQDRRGVPATGADAVHPGYGFLSERAEFAEALAGGRHRLHRPEPAQRSRRWATRSPRRSSPPRRRSRPCRPSSAWSTTRTRRVAAAREIGFPVMIKASAGGGGKGMRIAWSVDEVRRRLEPGALGGAVLLRRRPRLHRALRREPAPRRDPGARRQARQRHPPRRARMLDPAPQPEDRRGGAVAGGRRDAPRQAMGEEAVALAKAVGYIPPARSSSSSAQDRQVLLPRDEHAAPGRAPGDGAGHRHRPGRADDPGRGRRAARLRQEDVRSTAGRSSRGSMPRTRIASSCRRSGGSTATGRRRRAATARYGAASISASWRARRSRSSSTR